MKNMPGFLENVSEHCDTLDAMEIAKSESANDSVTSF